MKDFYSLEDLFCDGDFCDKFCEDCAGLRHVRNYPNEPDYDECTICGGDMTDPRCLKSSYCDDIEQSFRDLEVAIYNALSHRGEFAN